MAQRWEYTTIEFTLVRTQHGQQWAGRLENRPYSLYDVLNMLGEAGWELISQNVEEYRHHDRSRQASGYASVQYPFEQTKAIKQRAIFKRPIN